jgi:hypothetical protein
MCHGTATRGPDDRHAPWRAGNNNETSPPMLFDVCRSAAGSCLIWKYSRKISPAWNSLSSNDALKDKSHKSYNSAPIMP